MPLDAPVTSVIVWSSDRIAFADGSADAENTATLLARRYLCGVDQSALNTVSKAFRLEIPSFRFPEPIVTATSRGARIVLVPMPTATTVSIGVFVREGTATEPVSGMTTLAAAMLTRGTSRRSEAELATAIDVLGASQQTSTSLTNFGMGIVGLPDHVERLIELLAECILEPAFDADEFERVRQQKLSSFPLVLADSSYRARRIFQKLRYGDHPASRPPNGTPTIIAAIELDALRSWYERLLDSSGWLILMIGRFDAERICAAVQQRFERLGRETKEAIPPPPEPPPAIGIGRGLFTEQVELRVGHSAVPYTSDDYAAALLISTAFAGHFRSRINFVLREREGLTYGAFGGLTATKRSGTFAIATSTTPDNVPRAMELLRSEWHRLASEPLTEDELHQARQYLFGSFWRSVETPDAIAAMAIELVLHDLPSDFYDRLLARIGTLATTDLLPVQQRVFDPRRLIVAAVGDVERLRGDLVPLGELREVFLEEEQQ